MPSENKLTVAIVIPARLESTRLPRKLLLDQTGKTVIEHVWLAARQSQLTDQVIVATDAEEIADVVTGFGGQAVMTSVAHTSGTDRVAEAAAKLNFDLIVNLQGDEPDLNGQIIDRLIEVLSANSEAEVATLATPIRTRDQLSDFSCVKVVFDRRGRALYFSRNPIPAARDPNFLDGYFAAGPAPESWVYFQHLGIYGYRRDFLLSIPNMPRSAAEQIESLEQLRFLDQGHDVWVEVVDHAARGIDTAEDYALFVNRPVSR